MWLRYSPAHTKPPSTRRNAHRAHHTHRAHHELSGSGAIVAPRRHIVTATPTEGRLRGRPGERGARRAGSGEQGGPGAGSKAGRGEGRAGRGREGGAGSGKQGGRGGGKQGGPGAGSKAARERGARRAGSGKQGGPGAGSKAGPGAGSKAGRPLKPAAVSSEALIFDPESMAGYRGRVSRTASSGGAASGSPSYPFTVPNLPLAHSPAAAVISSGVRATKFHHISSGSPSGTPPSRKSLLPAAAAIVSCSRPVPR